MRQKRNWTLSRDGHIDKSNGTIFFCEVLPFQLPTLQSTLEIPWRSSFVCPWLHCQQILELLGKSQFPEIFCFGEVWSHGFVHRLVHPRIIGYLFGCVCVCLVSVIFVLHSHTLSRQCTREFVVLHFGHFHSAEHPETCN